MLLASPCLTPLNQALERDPKPRASLGKGCTLLCAWSPLSAPLCRSAALSPIWGRWMGAQQEVVWEGLRVCSSSLNFSCQGPPAAGSDVPFLLHLLARPVTKIWEKILNEASRRSGLNLWPRAGSCRTGFWSQLFSILFLSESVCSCTKWDGNVSPTTIQHGED